MKTFTSICRSPRRVAVLSLLSLLSVLSLGIILPSIAFAASTTPSTSTVSTPTQKCGATDVKCVIAFGDVRIVARQTALTTLDTKVTAQQTVHHITDLQASALLINVTTDQSGLAALKTKLDAETDAQVARQDIKAMYEQFRIFAVVLPRDYRRLHLDLEINLDSKQQTTRQQVELRIDKANATVQTQVNPLFADYKAQLAAAEGQIDTAQGIFPTLTVASFNADGAAFRSRLANLTTDEKAAQADLRKAAEDLRQIRLSLKSK